MWMLFVQRSICHTTNESNIHQENSNSCVPRGCECTTSGSSLSPGFHSLDSRGTGHKKTLQQILLPCTTLISVTWSFSVHVLGGRQTRTRLFWLSVKFYQNDHIRGLLHGCLKWRFSGHQLLSLVYAVQGKEQLWKAACHFGVTKLKNTISTSVLLLHLFTLKQWLAVSNMGFWKVYLEMGRI